MTVFMRKMSATFHIRYVFVIRIRNKFNELNINTLKSCSILPAACSFVFSLSALSVVSEE